LTYWLHGHGTIGWESEGRGFDPQHLQVTFDLRLPKNIKTLFPANVPLKKGKAYFKRFFKCD